MYLIFGILCAIALVFINRFVPETKGKSHEDFMDQDVKDKVSMSKPLLTDFQ